MRRMKTRQAIISIALTTLLLSLSACSSSLASTPTPTVIPSTPSATVTMTFTPSPIPPTATPTPLTCLTDPGKIKQDLIPNTNPPQEFLIYLPPCYKEMNPKRYPVLYLLHGQTYTQDQWVRIGAPKVADQLIHSGEVVPFIMVFPDDHYWNAPAGGTFGERLINLIIPYVDQNYRSLADRGHRALGGLSRGGGWTVQLGFGHPDLFGSLGLHSPAIFEEDAPYLANIIRKVPEEKRPRLWFDIGDADKELGSGRSLEEILTIYNYVHVFHLFTGDHTEHYWGAHVDEYLRWYAKAWQDDATQQ
jgi:enterochelin esterase-like enzyme